MDGTSRNSTPGKDFSNPFDIGKAMPNFADGTALLKLWLNNQQSAFQPANSSSPQRDANAAENPLQQLQDLWKNSLEKWLTLTQQQASAQSSEEMLGKLFDPSQWLKASQDPFHNAIEHLNAGPSYATLWDLDKKMLRAQQLRLEQERNLGAYHAIVRGGWKKAYELFLAEINKEDAAPIKSWRETTDIWVKIANEVMIDMHRTPEFLDAQRRMTRSATDYRLQEREIVEAFCDAHHIPTRTEVDEVQHTVHELRRQVRVLQRQLNTLMPNQMPAQTSPVSSPKPAAPVKKAAVKAPARKLAAMPRLLNEAGTVVKKTAAKKAGKK